MGNNIFHNVAIILTYLHSVSCATLAAILSVSDAYAKEISCGVLGFIIHAHSLRANPPYLRSPNSEEAHVFS